MTKSANAVLAKVRAMYGRMLSPAQYDELLRRRSVQEISAYLREKTTYADALSGVQDSAVHRGQLENLLHKDLFYQYIRLVRYIGAKNSTSHYVVMDMEVEMILSCLRAIISGHPGELITELPTFMNAYTSFDLLALAGVQTLDQLFEAVAHSPYEPVLRLCAQEHAQGEQIDYTAFEVALRTYYYTTLLAHSGRMRGQAGAQLRELISLRAETTNLNTIFRLKTTFGAPPEQIRAMMVPVCCKIAPKKLDRLIEAKDAQEFMHLLCGLSPYRRQLSPEMNYIEGGTENIRYQLIRRRLHFSTDPYVTFLAFMLIRGIETENIIRVIEGVRYRLPPDRISTLLCHYH